MKTFLKVLLILVAALFALKFLRLTLGLGFLLAGAVIGLLAVGFSILTAALAGAFAVVAALSPIWIPVLLIVGVITLIKGSSARSSGTLSS